VEESINISMDNNDNRIRTNNKPSKQQQKVEQGIAIIQHLFMELENLRQHNLYQRDKLNMLTRTIQYHFKDYLKEEDNNDGTENTGS